MSRAVRQRGRGRGYLRMTRDNSLLPQWLVSESLGLVVQRLVQHVDGCEGGEAKGEQNKKKLGSLPKSGARRIGRALADSITMPL